MPQEPEQTIPEGGWRASPNGRNGREATVGGTAGSGRDSRRTRAARPNFRCKPRSTLQIVESV